MQELVQIQRLAALKGPLKIFVEAFLLSCEDPFLDPSAQGKHACEIQQARAPTVSLSAGFGIWLCRQRFLSVPDIGETRLGQQKRALTWNHSMRANNMAWLCSSISQQDWPQRCSGLAGSTEFLMCLLAVQCFCLKGPTHSHAISHSADRKAWHQAKPLVPVNQICRTFQTSKTYPENLCWGIFVKAWNHILKLLETDGFCFTFNIFLAEAEQSDSSCNTRGDLQFFNCSFWRAIICKPLGDLSKLGTDSSKSATRKRRQGCMVSSHYASDIFIQVSLQLLICTSGSETSASETPSEATVVLCGQTEDVNSNAMNFRLCNDKSRWKRTSRKPNLFQLQLSDQRHTHSPPSSLGLVHRMHPWIIFTSRLFFWTGGKELAARLHVPQPKADWEYSWELNVSPTLGSKTHFSLASALEHKKLKYLFCSQSVLASKVENFDILWVWRSEHLF